MKLKFLREAVYNGVLKYPKGAIVEISDELGEASRWINRNIAEIVEEKVDVSKIENSNLASIEEKEETKKRGRYNKR